MQSVNVIQYAVLEIIVNHVNQILCLRQPKQVNFGTDYKIFESVLFPTST